MNTDHGYLTAEGIARLLRIPTTEARCLMQRELWPMARRATTHGGVQGAWLVRYDVFRGWHCGYIRACATAIHDGLATAMAASGREPEEGAA